jgi:hypothetical protein
MTGTTSSPSVHASRWGFHNSDYQTYRKLKALNFLYLEALRRAAAWQRWHRKEPHNRVSRRKDGSRTPLPEPPLSPLFSKKVQMITNFWKGKFVKEGHVYERVETTDHGVREAYDSTRPVASAAEVRPLPLSVDVINELFERAGLQS